MKKMFVFDYDGTFYRNPNEMQENMKLISKVRKQGHIFVIATGRSFNSFKKEIDKYHIKYDYLILASGGLILDQNHHIIDSYPMDLKLVKSLNQMMDDHHDGMISKRFIDSFDISESIIDLNQVLKMTYTYEKDPSNYDIQNKIDDFTNEQFRTYLVLGQTQDYIEIISKETNKGFAVHSLIKHLNETFDIIVAGDSENDIEMLIEFDGYLMTEHDPRLDQYHLRSADSIQTIIKKACDIE